METAIVSEIAGTKGELLETFGLFNNQTLNVIPFEGSWTGGQVAEHVLKSLSGVLQNTTGEVKATDRNPEEHIKQLGDIFLDMTLKMKSPDFIIPSNDPKDKEELMTALGNTLDEINDVAGSADLNATCTGFEMPGLGALTRMEWISFAVFHTTRHTNQLKNIYKLLHQTN
jgi:hypothetical protein